MEIAPLNRYNDGSRNSPTGLTIRDYFRKSMPPSVLADAKVARGGTLPLPSTPAQTDYANPESAFEQLLKAPTAPKVVPTSMGASFLSPAPSEATESVPIASAALDIATAYQKNAPAPDCLTDWDKYKDDQLLKNPGGDFYDLENRVVTTDPSKQRTFQSRVGKDLSDAWGNVKNFFKNMLSGIERCYRNQENNVATVRQNGLAGAMVDFFKDMGSALSFGAYRPDGEPPCDGLAARLKFSGRKLKEAVLGDLFQGVGNNVVHMGENLALAGWNLIEVAPDATIGNLEAGRQITTKIFDNGQVAVEYLTDIIPGGDAWLRVHAAKFTGDGAGPPVLYNLCMPEWNQADTRWETVRNTPLRKTIETIGSIVADVATINLMRGGKMFSEDRHDPKR